jgi:MFS family permease
MPIVMHALIESHGWPWALIAFATFEIVVCLPLVALLIKDSPVPLGLAADGEVLPTKAMALSGTDPDMTVGEVIRKSAFWRLAICFAIMGMSFYAIAPNIVYILTKKAGMSLGEVATIQAVTGIATLFGRIGFGFLLDRFHAPLIGVAALALTATCAAIFSATALPSLIIFASILNGLAIGGDTDLMPYLASRYFGTRAVSRIFGWFLFAFFLGAAVGPIAFAQLSAFYEGPNVPLMMLAGIQLIPAILFLSLGRYGKVHRLKTDTRPSLSHS